MAVYVCSVPLDADSEHPEGTPIYIVDILPKFSSRKQIDTVWWRKYRTVFDSTRIWITEPEEMQYRKIVNVKFHKGETL